jgi:hypothetical protein
MTRRRRDLHWATNALVACGMLTASIGLSACSAMKPPTEASISGLLPSGQITLTETFAAGYGAGDGMLTFNGESHSFMLLGAVMGPGGAERVTAAGEVYKLNNVSDFAGRYTQFSGTAGLSQGGSGELWLQNDAGVIMHLTSQTQGVLLSLGKEEVFVRLR